MHHPSPFDGHDSKMLGESDLIRNFSNIGTGGQEETREAPIRDLRLGVAGRDEREATALAQAGSAFRPTKPRIVKLNQRPKLIVGKLLLNV
jgi:hypothetical protein